MKELIKNFYDEDGFLKEEFRITFDRKMMIEIIKEIASLNLDLAAKSVTTDEL